MSQTTQPFIEKIHWTVRDVEALPQGEGTGYEIISGNLFVTRSPHHCIDHQLTLVATLDIQIPSPPHCYLAVLAQSLGYFARLIFH